MKDYEAKHFLHSGGISIEIRCGNNEKWGLLIFCIFIIILLFLEEIEYGKFFAMGLIVILLLSIPRYLYCFRHFRLEETGVEITYLGLFQKYYPWDSFVVRQMVRPLHNSGFDMYKPRRGHPSKRHNNPVLLSYKPILVPSCINYGYTFRHPLSCVFIGFDDEFPKYKHEWINRSERDWRDFETNREEFTAKMKEWGVEIKDLTDKED